VLRLVGQADPSEIVAGQTFWSQDEAEAERARLQSEAEEGVRFCVKETSFFSRERREVAGQISPAIAQTAAGHSGDI
jgi:hypothetical protein